MGDVVFIGVDLAWQSDRNHSGLAVLRQTERGAELGTYAQGIARLDAVMAFIHHHAGEDTVVAVDAPLLINNVTGQRACERSLSQKYGGRHASTHSSNLTLYPNAGSVRAAKALEQAGFQHPNRFPQPMSHGKWFFEVYPHAAQIVLFDLPRIIRYKKGRVQEKRAGLEVLRSHMRETLTRAQPALEMNAQLENLLGVDLESLRGQALKYYEDILDAVFCAYLALYFWYWGMERHEIFGDFQEGYILNPTHPL
jgi:predicted RNase H-like nuclease